jgi:hypothetical protein
MSETDADVKDAKGVVCVLDLGEHSRKRVRRLRRGEGKLMEKVEDAIETLHDEGVLDGKVQTVVVVVRQEQRLSDMFRDDDDDDDDD